jgi:hypothetical protein
MMVMLLRLLLLLVVMMILKACVVCIRWSSIVESGDEWLQRNSLKESEGLQLIS